MADVPKILPHCAICSAPPDPKCPCERAALEKAIDQAEAKYTSSANRDIRAWARTRARDYIISYYNMVSEPCKDAYYQDLLQLDGQQHHRARADADRRYRRNMNRAWRVSIYKFPEVLDYFYSLVRISLPDDDNPAIKHPPLDRLDDLRRCRHRQVLTVPYAPTPRFPIPPGPAPWAMPRTPRRQRPQWHPQAAHGEYRL